MMHSMTLACLACFNETAGKGGSDVMACSEANSRFESKLFVVDSPGLLL